MTLERWANASSRAQATFPKKVREAILFVVSLFRFEKIFRFVFLVSPYDIIVSDIKCLLPHIIDVPSRVVSCYRSAG